MTIQKSILTTLLFAAATPGLFAQTSAEAQPKIANTVTENYILTANDLISVKVFQEDDLSTTCRISADGTVGMPLIGQVKIAGKPADEAARQIAGLLKGRFLVNPQVNIGVTSIAKRRFTVLGQVLKAGAYNMQFQDSLDLLEAIGMAGGYTRLANPAKITVKRRDADHDVLFDVNGKELAAGRKGFRILPGDTITIGERLF